MQKLPTREELEALKKEDVNQYQSMISAGWETEAEDIAKVKAIMAQYDNNETNHFVVGDKPFPKWALDAYEFFVAKYGSQYGEVIYQKVLSKVWGEIQDMERQKL